MLWISTLFACGLIGGPEGISSEQPGTVGAVHDGAAPQDHAVHGGSDQHGSDHGGSHGSASSAAQADGPAPKGDYQSTDNAVVVGRDDAGNKGVRVGGENGVVAGANNEVDGVRVGGHYGVMAGSDEDTKGVRVGGSNGVMMGADDDTKGVRVGGSKGVVIDGRKGIKVGGKKLFGK